MMKDLRPAQAPQPNALQAHAVQPHASQPHALQPHAPPFRASQLQVPQTQVSQPGSPTPPLRAVCFDVDSTLVDFLRFKRIATQSAALAMVDAGLDMAPDLAIERLWETYRTEGLDGDVAFEAFLRGTVGRVDAHILAAGLHAYMRAKDTHLEPYPGVLPTLIQLVRRNLTLAVITDAPREKALHRLRALRLTPFFDVVLTLDDTLFGKADTQPYLQMAARLNLEPTEMLMVGDNPARDIRTAKRAGLYTALAGYGAQPHFATQFPDDKADFHLNRIDDLVGVVDRLRLPVYRNDAVSAATA